MQQQMAEKPKLDVKKIITPILYNYDQHVKNFIRLLKRIDCILIYDGPSDLQEHIRDKLVYACSVRKKGKLFKNVFPIMFGSELDIAIRKEQQREFTNPINIQSHDFETADIGFTFFLINGTLRQLPYFFTNDSSNMHIVNNKRVRCYTYDSNDKGKELNYNMVENKLYVVRNDGTESIHDANNFFDFCPYTTDQEIYMSRFYKENLFDIDHLANKIVISPGHLFVKLFVKYLYIPLKDENWSTVKSKLALVNKSIDSGSLLHVLSRKTVYFKESKSVGKMVSVPRDNYRELGMNGEIYVEKNTGCYRDVSLQNYPLFPYLSHLIIRQISSKVKNSKALAFHDSNIGFLCILGTFETKNIGRTNIMVQDTIVSACDDMDPVAHSRPGKKLYKFLNLSVEEKRASYYVVINEACIPVTGICFHRVKSQLKDLKFKFKTIECYIKDNFVHIRYKVGLFFKLMGPVYVTPRDELFWARELFGFTCKSQIVQYFGYNYITGHQVALNPFFKHDAFPKVIFGIHSLKSAVLATDPSILLYFKDTVSAYLKKNSYLKPVLEAVNDGFSCHFEMHVPHVTVAYMSFQGNNQEDCIIIREDLNAYDCFRFYTLRFKFNNSGGPGMVFHPVSGDSEDDFLGTLVYHGTSKLDVETLCVNVRIKTVNDNVVQLHFNKYPFTLLEYSLTEERLTICVKQFHKTGTGDKLCSFHGQKGVVRKMKDMPLLDKSIVPDLIVSPFSIFRVTLGQFIEGIEWGHGRDAQIVQNSSGKIIEGGKVFFAKTFYFPIAYFSNEHFYAPTDCVKDKITEQPVKGRSRAGGMRLGNMELLNGLRGNGIASCFEEKFFEHGDGIMLNNTMIPKSTLLVKEDVRFFKTNLDFKTTPCIVEVNKKQETENE
ncbi:DNA-directed RNA polymerase subunit B' like protein [Argiope bruennichi]|uniref:DNA-directed RNA polymerase n=1 Tax=Argiope bruennichi TaxID=94029 RepID=A0A8T0G4C4_ARGBR|nr:DNA-directed RNA polymerase subunit B' like protein [Argiope bruennichi]